MYNVPKTPKPRLIVSVRFMYKSTMSSTQWRWCSNVRKKADWLIRSRESEYIIQDYKFRVGLRINSKSRHFAWRAQDHHHCLVFIRPHPCPSNLPLYRLLPIYFHCLHESPTSRWRDRMSPFRCFHKSSETSTGMPPRHL